MTITVLSTDCTTGPSPYPVSVPKSGDTKTIINALSNACSLRGNEHLLVAKVYNSSLIWYFEEPSEVISLMRDGNYLAAYRLLKDSEDASIVVFKHQFWQEILEDFWQSPCVKSS
ncbi:hypothetical protein GUJ93_ZPchr0012g18988 [Zizania palustris]|uniref:Uncharacterized protein n=1 Tax=Zizania palustris TaxID=103762 RepID=A0A8J5WRI6_ZIZPA|nr:hypothetical protein GUJ93_ZPchr0012g18988 [Zizania palustris]